METVSPLSFPESDEGLFNNESDSSKIDSLCLLMEKIQADLQPLLNANSTIGLDTIAICSLLQRYSDDKAQLQLDCVQFRIQQYEPFQDAMRAAYQAEVDRAQSLLRSVTESETEDPLNTVNIGYEVYRELRGRSGLHRLLRSLTNSEDGINLVLSQVSGSLSRRLRRSLEHTVEQHTDELEVVCALLRWHDHVQPLFCGDMRGPHRSIIDMARAEILLRTASLLIPPTYQVAVKIDSPVQYVPVLPIAGLAVTLPTHLSQRWRWHQLCIDRLDAALAPAHRPHLTRITENRLRLARAAHEAALMAKRTVTALLDSIKDDNDDVPGEWASWGMYWPAAASHLDPGFMAEMQVEVGAVFLLHKQWRHVQRLTDSETASVTDLVSALEVIATVYRSCSSALRKHLLLLEQCVKIDGRTLQGLKTSVKMSKLGRRRPLPTRNVVRALARYQNFLPDDQAAFIRRIAVRLGVQDEPAVQDHVCQSDNVTLDELLS